MKSTIDYSEIVSLSGVDEIEQLVTTYCIKYYQGTQRSKGGDFTVTQGWYVYR